MKKILLILISIMFVSSMLFIGIGCKEEETAPAEEAVEETTEEVAEEEVEEEAVEEVEEEIDWAAKNITINMWWLLMPDDYWTKMIEDFEEEYGINVKVEVLPMPSEDTGWTRIAAGDIPDMWMYYYAGEWLYRFNPDEDLRDLSHVIDASKILFNLNMVATRNEKLLYVPMTPAGPMAAYYNKEVFADIEGELPNNWEEFKALLQKAKDSGYIPLYMPGGSGWPYQVPHFMYLAEALRDSALMDGISKNEIAFTDDRFVQSVQEMKNLADEGLYNDDYLTASYESGQIALMENKALCMTMGEWFLDAILATHGQEEVDKKIGFFGVSKDSRVVPWTGSPAGQFLCPKTGDPDREAATDLFISYITGPRYQEFINSALKAPVYEGFDIPEGMSILLLETAAAMEDSVPTWKTNVSASCGDVVAPLNELMAGTITALEAMEAWDFEFTQNAKATGIEGF